ncbi:hypothetical protein Sme01_21370 [Sphaerisporangium melleum]|uniref:DUF397 domain-containing protein n=1 Tax=Sphaerisporangium melleum TaxID=321316 RepID=A0A917RNV6_9ACTN|nr:DUF397 domain-containing protein [Sphaerisporangium melleum]GGL15640.1 hypothetical protein GCM10007964_67030 [Sphaerisporangium melleum]GII69661.1 hypothetical protein Sme01_21370 [Sphaerisporangium melleum]
MGELRDAQWRKSTYSTDNGNCVEVASNLPSLVAIRDSKNPDAPALVLTPAQWSTFLIGLKTGVLDV